MPPILGLATLIGYIFGAPVADLLIKYFTLGQLIRAAMLMSSISYLGCALEGAPLMWFYVLRTLAGVAGAMLMVLAPPAIVRMHDSKIKARISGVIFSGIGLGAMLSGTLLPVLIYHSLVSAWLGMGIVALIATMLTWNAWIASDTWQKSENSSYKGEALSFKDLSKPQMMTLGLILSAYTFNAIGYLPHTLF